MKDYSLNYEASKTFILNYKIEDNQIIVNLASGEEYIIPYSLKNEKKLLALMKEQVLVSDVFKSKQEKRFSGACKWVIWNSAMFVAIEVFYAVLLATGSSPLPIVSGIVNGIYVGVYVFNTTCRVYSMIDSKKKIKDVNKNRMFLNNEELLNEKVKSNQNILSNTNAKTKELVSSTPEDAQVFSLNTMDKIKYQELKTILENIKRDVQFGFEYSSTEEEKPMVLTKKKNN